MRRLRQPLRFFVALIGCFVILGTTFADPPVTPPPTNDPIPPVFCFRITDIERVDLMDITPGNDFVFEFELLNWTATPASGLFISQTDLSGFTGPPIGASPTIVGAGVDRDGRGGPLGGTDINASGAGLTTGLGTFDSPAIHSGRGRGDIGGFLNDWTPTSVAPTTATWAAGTPIPFQDLVGVSAPGGVLPAALIPSPNPDLLGDSSVDGGPGTMAFQEDGITPISDGDGNVLDGFTMTLSDFDEGEIIAWNWFLMDGLEPIGTAGGGNAFGFGTLNLTRTPLGGPMPGPVFVGNTGFNRNSDTFFDSVWNVPNPAEFAAELGAGITAPFINPPPFFAPVNTQAVPEPSSMLLLVSLSLAALCVQRKTRSSFTRVR